MEEIEILDVEEKKDKKRKHNYSHFRYHFIRSIGLVALLVLCFYVGTKSTHLFSNQEDLQELGLKDMGELVTQSCNAKVLENTSVNRELFGIVFPFTESRQIYSYVINVNASINFEEIDYEIKKDLKEIEIIMPHAKIMEANLDENSFQKYLDSESLFSRIPLEKQNTVRLAMIDRGRNECINNKILEKADSNGEKIIENFIKANKEYKDYKVVFNYKEVE